MDSESRRDLQLLEALEQESRITQRTLATRLGIALGLTNLYLKRLVRKGYVKCVTVAPNRLMYLVTPRGVARRARLTYEFMKYSLDFYRDVRRHLRESLTAVVTPQKRVAIYGTGEAAELVFLLLKEMGLDPVAAFDGERSGKFLGVPVRPIEDHGSVGYDVLIVAVLERPAATRKRLLSAGVAADKIVLLRRERSKNGAAVIPA
ncbi:MAG: winged helix-turn-helix transcriptional regulator [Vicinamibacterales bacterium]